MCGRYALFETDKLAERYGVKIIKPIKQNFNVAPTQDMPVIRLTDGKRELEIMHWGIPRIVGPDTVREIINTRVDKAFGRFWKKQITTQRVLIPANAFYEWKKTKEGKVPFLISLPNQELYSFAGIWNSWTDKDGNKFDAFSIMTSDPNYEMKGIHDRMPVILQGDQEDIWLNDDLTEEEISELLIPAEDGRVVMYQVSTDVNSVRNNYPELISKLI